MPQTHLANNKLLKSAHLGDDRDLAVALAAGADSEAENAQGPTAAMLGSIHGNADGLRLLFSGGAAPRQVQRWTDRLHPEPLHGAHGARPPHRQAPPLEDRGARAGVVLGAAGSPPRPPRREGLTWRRWGEGSLELDSLGG